VSETTVIIPIRGSQLGKSRLSPMFGATERSRIVAAMAEHVIGVVLETFPDGRVMVVTRDPDIAWLTAANHPRVAFVRQPDNSWGLNAAIDGGRHEAMEAQRLLVLSGDLPLLSPGDLTTFSASDTPVTIATDEAGGGTNALLLDGTHAIARFPFQFGEGSRQRHVDAAIALGLASQTLRLPGLMRDLDTPADWDVLPGFVRERLLAGEPGPAVPATASMMRETA